MRYRVRARLRVGRAEALLEAIEDGTLGQGSIAGGEYLRNMADAVQCADDTVRWVEVCYCPSPLLEERPYWEAYFELTKVVDAHDRRRCRDWSGEEPWACSSCDCSERLEAAMTGWGERFLERLVERVEADRPPEKRS
ncbi:MAG: hypothetical protein R3272_08130 [Candidatus Promineifilaceae bacterium]|nr:hypothetical protein [Candidatus Promineifilaceae bacterium]